MLIAITMYNEKLEGLLESLRGIQENLRNFAKMGIDPR